MCGIIGFISKGRKEDLIKNLVNSITHRGPDDNDYLIIDLGNGFLHLGSARLSINGLNDGKMPMESDSGIIIYNGELFEINKLKNLIKRQTNTSNDTKHLLNLLDQEGVNALNHLNGMYSFAYFNKKNNELILHRDNLGIKPLYFGKSVNYPLVFSSEIKPLLENQLIENITSLESIYDTLAYGGIRKNNEFIKNLKSLDKNSYVLYKNENFSINKIINTLPEGNEEKFEINKFNTLFGEVVNDHLTADVDVNILLSGGIDSSLLSYFASQNFNKKVKVFTLAYENSNFNEEDRANKLAKSLELEHVKLKFPTEKNTEIIDDLIHRLPEPILDPSIVPTYYLSKEVSKYTKAVLSGDGADELFGGYEWYRAMKIKEILTKFRLKNTQLNFLNVNLSSHLGIFTKLNRFSTLYHKNFAQQQLIWQNSSPLFKRFIENDYYDEYIYNKKLNKFSYNNLRDIDIDIYLYTNILKKSDTASMLNGLEIRPPFLDRRLVEYALRLDFKKQFSIFQTKLNLRNVLKQFNKTQSNFTKKGFTHDFKDWSLNVGIPYLKTYSKDFEIIKELDSFDNEYFLSHAGIRDVWKLYSVFKWLDINKTDVI